MFFASECAPVRVRILGAMRILATEQPQIGSIERLIGSIRRECLDHRVVLGEGTVE
jgi:hypothetical protein